MDIENEEFILFLTCAQKSGLRYMCIGGYAVNYYGFHRSTEDMDIWIAPTELNKECFFNTLFCMGYDKSETDFISKEDFTDYFMFTLGSRPHVIDVLTIVHKDLSFDEAEKKMEIHEIGNGISFRMVPYNYLKDMKIRAHRDKDLWDISQLEKLRIPGK